MKKYVYLPMPCDKAKVKELNAQGFKVLDERFKPAEVKAMEEKAKPKRKPRAKK
jgi:hypothetical protein